MAQNHDHRVFVHGRTLKALVLDDGSRWEVDETDKYTSEMWSEMDRVVIIEGEMYKLDDSEKVSVEQEIYPSVTIFIIAATWAGFAVWLGLDPVALLAAFGMDASTPQMLTEVRAFYGGVEMAIAVAMIVLWQRGDSFASLFVGGLPLLGSATGRCVGMLADGFSTMHLGFAGLEVVAAALCFIGCRIVTRETRNADVPR